MLQESLNLFKALPLDKKKYSYDSSAIIKKTLKHGYIFSPEIFEHFPKKRMDEIMSLVEHRLISSAEEMNSTFHKSWNKVKTAPYLQLILEQIMHYITTYGYESLGVYDENLVYIPNENLDIPELDWEEFPLMVIKGYTKAEIKDKITKILSSGIALAEKTIDDLIILLGFTGPIDIDLVKNKQVRMFLYKELGEVPKNPTEFLRYVLYDVTGKTLLIKDKQTIEAIKTSYINPAGLFRKYEDAHGLAPLASIFYRFKVLFLALKGNKEMKPVINRLRKLAKYNHKPMKEDYLNAVTRRIKDGTISSVLLKKEMSKVNIFRKIRLAYALKYRTLDVDSIMYKIRNGKGYVTEFDFPNTPMLKKTLDVIVSSIVDDVAKNVNGKTIYIPKHVNYTLPATEKQFTGNFPSGTSVDIKKDLIFGIQWKNNPGYRVDLDLSLINADGKIGWNGMYRDDDGKILFSGDVTDAPNGASELFYVKKQAQQSCLVYLNYYNYEAEQPVEFKIVTAQRELQKLTSNYMIDPNNVVAFAKSTMDKSQKVLGIVTVTNSGCKFYFSETYVGRSISSSNSERSEMNKNYLVNFYKNAIGLESILKKAGANIFHENDIWVDEYRTKDLNPDEFAKAIDIDLSPEKIEKDTILNLLI